MTSVSNEEQETTISFSRNDTGAEIWTSDRTVMTKLDRMCRESPETWKCKKAEYLLDGSLANKVYTVSDKSLISFRSRKIKRDLTDEQRAELSARMKRSARHAKFSD